MAAFIPDDQFIPDAPLQGSATPSQGPSQSQAQASQPGFIPDNEFVGDEDKYGSGAEQLKAGLEGVVKGVVGPLAPYAEEQYGAEPEDILGREKANPVTKGVGEAIGLVGSQLTGVGEGALMEKAGVGAAKLAGLAEPASYIAKVGSAAVKGATEMAILQSGDEASKRILQDPDAASESAIGNIGLSALLGGGTGAFLGAVNPVWKSIAGEPIEKALNVLKDHMDGVEKLLPTGVKEASEALGVEVPEVIKGANTTEANKAHYADLKRMENPEVLNAEEQLHKNVSDSVSSSLGVSPEEVSNYSENEAGHDLHDTWKKEYDTKYKPFEAKFAQREAEANTIAIPDEVRLNHYDKMIQDGIEKVGTDSPYYKEYSDYAQRVLAKDTVGGIDNLRTEIFNRIKGLRVGGDHNTINALNDIRNSLGELQERQIAKQSIELEKAGIAGGRQMGEELLAERRRLNEEYKNFAKMSDELASNLGVGRFSGAGTLSNKLANEVTPEQLLKKFSIRNNQDFVPFLQQYFPETLAQVQKNELKNLVKPAILSAKGENLVNVKKLGDIVKKNMAGKSDYLSSVMSPESLQKIEAGQKLLSLIPSVKDSGTPVGLLRNLVHMPASAMAMVSSFLGHNPVMGGLAGYLSQFLGRKAPDAIKLGLLKFAGSSDPIKSEAFKAMVDFMHSSIKGQNIITKASQAVLKSGAEVLGNKFMPTVQERDKLDKQVDSFINNPAALQTKFSGDLGHYLPNHQQSSVQAVTRSVQYLADLKPRPALGGPLDSKIPPSASEVARYNRALDIANQPAVVLKYAKEGLLQPSDIQDLHNMYPNVYKMMVSEITNSMASRKADGEVIPYKTKMGVSLLLGQPLDSTMSPNNIMAAQPMPVPPVQQQMPKGSKTTSKLGKTNKSYMTVTQNAENDRSSRE